MMISHGVRDIRLNMEQDAEHRGTFDFSGRVNRDQRICFIVQRNGDFRLPA